MSVITNVTSVALRPVVLSENPTSEIVPAISILVGFPNLTYLEYEYFDSQLTSVILLFLLSVHFNTKCSLFE